MDQQLQATWQEALKVMEKSFSEVVFDTCIKRLTPLYIDGDVFVLKTDMDFFKITIEQRHLHKITSIIKAVTEQDYTVKIVSPEDFHKTPNSSSLEELMKKSNLKSKYVFDTFVRGKSNELAHAAALAVAEAPGRTTYNPLFLYGGVGLGKTHLMHSVGNYILEQNQQTKVLYFTSETFTNEFVYSIREQKNQEFRNKYRAIDVLLIDDIQFFSDKEGVQEEFFHTFNTLYNDNKQIVISSDLPPKDLKTLEDRLRNRFSWGLIVDVTPPDFETRIAILEKKADIEHLDFPKDVLKFIAKSISSNIRDLEGALNKVAAYAKLSNNEITLSLAAQALKDLIPDTSQPQITVDYILETVAAYYNISYDEIKSKKRTNRIAYPRQVAMYLCRKLLDMSLPALGTAFGRDHSTISHGCEKITDDMEKDGGFRETVIALENKIKG